MELRQLRYFVVVAEELHFGRAAERLYIAQSPLSRQIRALERELGTVLLRRTTRHVELTAAGNALLDEARIILAAVDKASKKVSSVGSFPQHTLRVSFTDSAAHALLGKAVTLVKSMRGDISIDLQTGLLTRQQLAALVDERIDVAFIVRPEEVPPGVDMCTLHTEPLVLLLPDAHPMAHQDQIDLNDLRDEPFVCFPGEGRSVVREIFEKLCDSAGFQPVVTHTAHELSSVLDLVKAGLGCAPMPESVRGAVQSGVVVRPFVRGPMVEVAMAWRRGEEHNTVREIVTRMRKQLADLPDLPRGAVARPGRHGERARESLLLASHRP